MPAPNDMISLSDLSNMGWEKMLRLRKKYSGDPMMQQMLAPFEHQAYARQYTQEHPVAGPIAMAVDAPAYQLAKLFGIKSGRSQPSLDELFAAYSGIMQGMR